MFADFMTRDFLCWYQQVELNTKTQSRQATPFNKIQVENEQPAVWPSHHTRWNPQIAIGIFQVFETHNFFLLKTSFMLLDYFDYFYLFIHC
jgi:hypothetical protein